MSREKGSIWEYSPIPMHRNPELQLKNRAVKFNYLPLALDESCDARDTGQLLIFLRGITAAFKITEELTAMPVNERDNNREWFLHTGKQTYTLLAEHLKSVPLLWLPLFTQRGELSTPEEACSKELRPLIPLQVSYHWWLALSFLSSRLQCTCSSPWQTAFFSLNK